MASKGHCSLKTIHRYYATPLSFLFQPELCQSISKFMAFTHGSVNQMSKMYLANERRYNYTTPKSFLELVQYGDVLYCVLERARLISEGYSQQSIAWGVKNLIISSL